MDVIKLFAKNEKELESQIQTVRICSQDIWMESGIEKCAMLKMKNGNRHRMETIEQPNQDKFRTLWKKKTYKYLGILEADTIKHADMIENFFKKNTPGERENY